jgi:hypothetical protein
MRGSRLFAAGLTRGKYEIIQITEETEGVHSWEQPCKQKKWGRQLGTTVRATQGLENKRKREPNCLDIWERNNQACYQRDR